MFLQAKFDHRFLNFLLFFLLPLLAFPIVHAQDSTLSDGQAFIADSKDRITNLSTEELKLFLKQNPETEFIDVRLPFEIAAQGGLIDAGRRTHQIPEAGLNSVWQMRYPILTPRLYCIAVPIDEALWRLIRCNKWATLMCTITLTGF